MDPMDISDPQRRALMKALVEPSVQGTLVSLLVTEAREAAKWLIARDMKPAGYEPPEHSEMVPEELLFTSALLQLATNHIQVQVDGALTAARRVRFVQELAICRDAEAFRCKLFEAPVDLSKK